MADKEELSKHFPTTLYHPTKAPKGQTFQSMVEVEEQIGDDKHGWTDSPAKFPKERESGETAGTDVEALKAENKRMSALLDVADDVAQECKTLHEQNDALRKENGELKAKVASLEAAKPATASAPASTTTAPQGKQK